MSNLVAVKSIDLPSAFDAGSVDRRPLAGPVLPAGGSISISLDRSAGSEPATCVVTLLRYDISAQRRE
jgi:hypothetical protein